MRVRWRPAIAVATVLVLSAVAFVVLNPIGAAAVWLELTGYPTEPPPIAEGQITKDDWPGGEPANTKLTTLLRKRFPVGSDPSWLRAVMKGQGFSLEHVDLGMHSSTFAWGNAVCGQWMSVSWTEDDRGRISDIHGNYSTACL